MAADPRTVAPLTGDRAGAVYRWPDRDPADDPAWQDAAEAGWRWRAMPESAAELEADSRWPALFPSNLSIVTTRAGDTHAIEKVVGAAVVNRFPYVVALSFCRASLSSRHYRRTGFMEAVERSGSVAIQFLPPGPDLDRALAAIAAVPDDRMAERATRASPGYVVGHDGDAPLLDAAYMAYEGRLVSPDHDLGGEPINAEPWVDCGSHRIYFFEIRSIALRSDIAGGRRPLQWRSLPVWRGGPTPSEDPVTETLRRNRLGQIGYVKTYQPDYVFPSPRTIAFAGEMRGEGAAVLKVKSLTAADLPIDNDAARWPAFFPSSLALITVRSSDGAATAFPCGSTTIVSRAPLTMAICVSYGRINDRYAPRASLDRLRAAGRFGCGVPVFRPDVLDAIGYLGNLSFRDVPDKLATCGLRTAVFGKTVGFLDLPIHFDCRIVGERRLGTHAMMFGEVERVFANVAVTPQTPLEWCPWAGFDAPEGIA